MTDKVVMKPPVRWAQRKDLIFLTFDVEDIKNSELKFEDNKVYFKGSRNTDKGSYEADMTLYGEINRETSQQRVSGRNIELILMKKEGGPYWPRLLQEKAKPHWISTDFNKWQDEFDSEDENGGTDSMDMDAMMRQMGQLSDLGGKPNMDLEEDSDDEDMPDLEG